jgi:hypothetical protein
MAARFKLSADDDLLALFPRLDDIWPRKNDDGSIRYDWEVHHQQAANYIERRLRATKSVPERFQLGRLSPRSKEDLREASACLALSFIFRAADTQGDETGYYDRNAKHFEHRGIAALTDASILLDYDVDNSGDFGAAELQQPFPVRVIRG